MNKAAGRGFTLIELMIVLALISIMTPLVFDLYEDVMNRGVLNGSEAEALRDSRVFFQWLGRDLRNGRARCAPADKGGSEGTLVLNTLAGVASAPKKMTVTYSVNGNRELVREQSSGQDGARSIVVLMRRIEQLEFVYHKGPPGHPSLLDVTVTRANAFYDVGHAKPMIRSFSLGAPHGK